jgi:hypothetical protein
MYQREQGPRRFGRKLNSEDDEERFRRGLLEGTSKSRRGLLEGTSVTYLRERKA